MRTVFQVGLTLSAALLLSSVASAQRPGGGAFQPRAQSAVDLLRIKEVKEEIKLTEEQEKKLPEVMAKALGEVLNPDQLKRLRQIELQQKGINAFKEAKVQEALKLTAEQKDTINTIMEDLAKETKELFGKGGKGGFNLEAFKKIAALRKEANEKIQGLLKADQKSTWKNMIGEEFKMPTFRPGGGGGGGGAADQPQIRRRPGQQGNPGANPQRKGDA